VLVQDLHTYHFTNIDIDIDIDIAIFLKYRIDIVSKLKSDIESSLGA